MRILAFSIPFLLFLTIPIHAVGRDGGGSPTADEVTTVIPYSFDPPVLDGYISSEEWQGEVSHGYFDPFDGTSFREVYPSTGSDEEFTDTADLSVDFYLVYDDIYLYFAANVTDQTIVVDSGPTFYRDDGVELLIDGAHDMDWDQRAGDPWPGYQDGTTLLTLADNSFHYDYGNSTPYERFFGQDRDWFAMTRTGSGFYSVEMRVRLDEIASPRPGDTIGLNVGINDDDTGDLSKTALKWTGKEVQAGENPTFKNESLWGSAVLETYVKLELPKSVETDEDVEVSVAPETAEGNHPDFATGSNYTWTLPIEVDGVWKNMTRYGQTFVHVFEDPVQGQRLILDLTDPSGTTARATTIVNVVDVTPPSVSYSDGHALEEVPYTFEMEVSDNVDVSRIEWALYDHGWFNFSTVDPVFEHTFDHPGDYILQFIVFDEAGNNNSADPTISVADNMPPIVSAGIDTVIMDTEATYPLYAPDAYDDTPEGPSTDLAFVWTFVGEHADRRYEGEHIEVSIDVPGGYLGKLNVTDKAGFSTWKEFDVIVIDRTLPVPNFTLPDSIGQYEVFELNGSGSSDNAPYFIVKANYTWTIRSENGTAWNVYGPVIAVSIDVAGPASITLVVTDPAGNSANMTRNISVLDREGPVVVLKLAKGTYDQNEEIFLDITGSSDNVGIVSVGYEVYLTGGEADVSVLGNSSRFAGLGPLNQDPFFRITIGDPGDYRIDLSLVDAMVQVTSASAIFKVRDSTDPIAAINATEVQVLVDEKVHLSGSGSSDPEGGVTFEWMLDNATSIGTGETLEHVFPSAGNHTITLIVTDGGGNTDVAYCRIIVTEPPPEDKDDDSWIEENAFLIAAIVMIAIVLLAILVLTQRRKEPIPEKEE